MEEMDLKNPDSGAQISGRIKRERARESERNKYKREGEKYIER